MASTILTNVGDTLWLTVKGVTIDEGSGPVVVSSAAQFDTFNAVLKAEDDTVLQTLAMSLSTNPAHPDGTWHAQFNTPNRPTENVCVDAVITKGTSSWTYEGVVRVKG